MQLAQWNSVIWPVIAILLAIYVPGSLTGRILGRRGILSVLAFAPLISMIVAGLSGIIAYAIHIRWNWGTYLISCAIVLTVVALARWLVIRHRHRVGHHESVQRPHEPWSHAIPAIFGVLLGGGLITTRLVRNVPSPDQLTQNYDTIFHDNVVANIVVNGQASSLHALSPVRETYPIAFQQFAALGKLANMSLTVPAATLSCWLVFAAVIYPISMLYLVRTVCGRHMLTDFAAPALVAVAGGMPYLLLDWGSLYSMFAGQMIMPVLFAATWRWVMRDWHRGAARCWTGISWIVVGVAAVSFAHFRVMMTFLLLALPLFVYWCIQAGRALRRAKGVRALQVAISAVVVVILLVFAAGAYVFARMYLVNNTRPISDHLNGGQAWPTDTYWSAIGRFLTGTPVNSLGQRMPVDWIMTVLLAVAVIAVLVIRGRRRTYGTIFLISFALLGIVCVASAATMADWAKIVTALWYKDQRRPFSAWAMVAIPLICLGLRSLCDWWDTHTRHLRMVDRTNHSARLMLLRIPRTLFALLVLLCVLINPQADAMAASVGSTMAFAQNGQDTPILSEDEYLLLKRLDDHVPASDVIVSDPWNGSGFALAVGDRQLFYPHLYMVWDADHTYLAQHLDQITTDPQVCQVLNNHKLRWYIDMGGSYAPGDPQHAVFDGMGNVPQDALKLVDSQGNAKLYEITACQ